MQFNIKNYIYLSLFILTILYFNQLNAKLINFPVNKSYNFENYINKADFQTKTKYKLHSDIFAYGINISSVLLLIYTKDANMLINYGTSTLSIIGLKELTKANVSRYRPDLSKNNSYFSGHTSIAFNAAMVLSLKYGLKATIIALPVAMYVGYSRVMALKHYPSDVIVGAIMGILNALIWVKIRKLRFKIMLLITTSLLPYVFIAFY